MDKVLDPNNIGNVREVSAGDPVNQPRPGSPGGLRSAPGPRTGPIDAPRPQGIVAPWAERPEGDAPMPREEAERLTEGALRVIRRG